MSEVVLIPSQEVVCNVGTTPVVGSPVPPATPTGPLTGLSKLHRKVQVGLSVASGTAAHITGVAVVRGVGGGQIPTDAARSAAALAALSAGNPYSVSFDGPDVLDGLGVEITVGTAPVTLNVEVLAETLA